MSNRLHNNYHEQEIQIDGNNKHSSNSLYKYKSLEESFDMNEKRLLSLQYHQDNQVPSSFIHDESKSYVIYKNLKSKETSVKCTISENEKNKQVNMYYLENTEIYNREHDALTLEETHYKTPVSILNEWSLRNNGTDEKKPYAVFYELVAVSGLAHKPIYTIMCKTLDKRAYGEGVSKKEAKHHAANQMMEILCKIKSTANSDKVITSTTVSNNYVVDANGGSMKNSQTMNNNDNEMQRTDYSQFTFSNLNPIGDLQELTTAYKLPHPSYETITLPPHGNLVSYKVSCNILNLLTSGIANHKKEAKRIAARMMYDHIHNIGIDQLNRIKNPETKVIFSFEDHESGTNEISHQDWTSAQMFRAYFTMATNVATIDGSNNMINRDYQLNYHNGTAPHKQRLSLEKYQNEVEKLILDFDPVKSSSLKLLEMLSKKLCFKTCYVDVSQLKGDNGQVNVKSIMLQVTTKPAIVTTANGSCIEEALEQASKSVLSIFKSMLFFT